MGLIFFEYRKITRFLLIKSHQIAKKLPLRLSLSKLKGLKKREIMMGTNIGKKISGKYRENGLMVINGD